MPISTRPSFLQKSNEEPQVNVQSQNNNKPRIEFELSEPFYSMEELVLPILTKSELQRAIALRRFQKEVFEDWGFSNTHKYDNKMIINLYGEPGTGKTMAAHAIAKSLNKKIILINYGDIESKFVGETPKNIKSAFDFAKAHDAILFFDEADAILSRRVTNMTSATDTSVNQTRSVMLTLLNDYNDTVIFATNFISNYDPAFMRRILMHIEFVLPDASIRKYLFERYIPNQLPHSFKLNELIEVSNGLSGSDISNAILLAAFAAKTDGRQTVSHDDLLSKINSIKKSKDENAMEKKGNTEVTQRIVSEDYVKSQIGSGAHV
ncbi:AAA family ATPase [Enhydrobacter sp. AX1]|nr:ATP-binding protein [Enhydrobacter sp. AX1]VXA91502.1 AAA family ATPase [Enhydrobacter sp. AX1]